ncbi:MAG: PHP domain-containing protein [Paenibacillaceae bacterium]
MKVDFHFHLEEGPYSTSWLQRTARAMETLHRHNGESPDSVSLPEATHTLIWIKQLMSMLQERTDKGCFDIEWLSLYLKQGRQQGISHFGIVDHLYRFSEFRPYYERHMTLDDSPLGKAQRHWLDRVCMSSIESFVDVVREAQHRGYPISLGIEADYFPNGEVELGELLGRYELDYVIGSVHFLDGWGFDNPNLKDRFREKDLTALYRQFFDCVKAAASSGLFDIIAHLDNLKVFNYRPDEHILLPMYEDVARTLKQANVATEVNTGLAYRYPVKEMCPSPAFLNILHQHGVPLTLSSDAHFPDDLGTMLDEAIALISNVGYTEIVYYKERERIYVDLID